jgi:hypothetical protein
MTEAIEYDVEDLPDDELSQISITAAALNSAKAEKEKLESLLKQNAVLIQRLETQDLPAAMKSLGMAQFTLEDGTQIKVQEEVHCGISDSNRLAALEWLRTSGNESIIKRVVSVYFGKGEDNAAHTFVDTIKEALPDNQLEDKVSVHPSTLKSFVKERIELEKEDSVHPDQKIPRDLFGVFIIERAQLKQPKK